VAVTAGMDMYSVQLCRL